MSSNSLSYSGVVSQPSRVGQDSPDLSVIVPTRNEAGNIAPLVAEIAKALAMETRLLVMDEPTAALSGREVEDLFTIVRQLRSQGVAILFISHRFEEIFDLADRVTVLRDGAYVGTRPVGEVTRDELIRMMVGRTISNLYPKQDVEAGDLVRIVLGAFDDRVVERFSVLEISMDVLDCDGRVVDGGLLDNLRRMLRGKDHAGGLLGVTERAADGEPGDLRLQNRAEAGREILEVDGGEAISGNGVELDFVAGGNAEQADLGGGTINSVSPTSFTLYAWVQVGADGFFRIEGRARLPETREQVLDRVPHGFG